jgi:predicted transcriptional regulator
LIKSLMQFNFLVEDTRARTISYRDRVYMFKDIILKLIEYGELNQTALISFCGLNISNHRSILEKMQRSGLIARTRKSVGKMSITVYVCTPEELKFCRNILEPYEKIFPRQRIITKYKYID